MCHYQTLYHDDNKGYVVRCASCEKIQIAYGNLMMTFGKEDFDAFRWWLHRIKGDQPAGQCETLRCIVIPTPCEGMKLLVSYRELCEFESMLEAADSEIQSLEMLRLFDQQ